MNKSKTLEIQNTLYAMASEFSEGHKYLTRLADQGLVTKVIFDGVTYYDVEGVRRLSDEQRSIPKGYVRAADHATLLGFSRSAAYEACQRRNAKAKKVIAGAAKAAWYADKSWLETALGVVRQTTPTITKAPAPSVKATAPNDKVIATLQAQVQELREVVNNLSRGRHTTKTVNITDSVARERGYRPAKELIKEFEIAGSTLRGWAQRNVVRSYHVGGRLYIHMEDFDRMYMKLPENRAAVKARMGLKQANGQYHGSGTWVAD